MVEIYNKYKIQINRALYLAVIILFAYILVRYFFALFAPFAVGFIISALLDPLVSLLQKRFKIPRGISGLFLIIIIILLLIFAGTVIISRVAREAVIFAAKIPEYAGGWQKTAGDIEKKLTDMLKIIPPGLSRYLSYSSDNLTKSAASWLTNFLGHGIGQGGFKIIKAVPNTIVNIFLSIISAFFFIKDKELIYGAFNKIIPDKIRKSITDLKSGFLAAFIGYIKAQLIIMSVTGTICILGLIIMGYPFALLMGLIIAIVDAVPVFGSGFILWPWALYEAINKNYYSAVILMIIYAAVFLTRQFMEPKILSGQIGVHPLVTLISMFAGLKIFGPLGFIIGPLIVITAKIIFNHEIHETHEKCKNFRVFRG